MSYKVEITVEAHLEITDAFNYYEKQRIGLGEDFLSELQDQLSRLSENPLSYSFIGHTRLLRDVKIRRFPYVVVYLLRDDVVAVLSVHCTWRRPFIP